MVATTGGTAGSAARTMTAAVARMPLGVRRVGGWNASDTAISWIVEVLGLGAQPARGPSHGAGRARSVGDIAEHVA